MKKRRERGRKEKKGEQKKEDNNDRQKITRGNRKVAVGALGHFARLILRLGSGLT